MQDRNDFEPIEGGVEVRVDEHRSPAKISVELGVTENSDSNFYVGFSGDVRDGGLFIATHQMVPVGRTLKLTLHLPDASNPIETQARVLWQRTAVDYGVGILPGFAVEFLDLGEKDLKNIEAFIASREPIFHPA